MKLIYGDSTSTEKDASTSQAWFDFVTRLFNGDLGKKNPASKESAGKESADKQPVDYLVQVIDG